jgi:Zn-dependent M16 (insulinase) family peptidase
MTLHGFELIQERHIAEYNTQARLYRHVRTGAQLLSMANSDENKVFSINFCTPPTDSTGLPHILEHSVLGGSRKYPVKEPFMELVKGSLKTFVNAMTFPDMTVYPVASQNLKDFYNLIDVYMDAVFYPRISEKTLQQEGWHYELAGLDAPLTYSGVVFNEMKGVYSSPDAVMGDFTRTTLMPDTIYGHNYGGDPAVIPDLTYANFKRFHETYYHPSNARFFFYGDDPVEDRLRLVDAFITEFERIPVKIDIQKQSRWSEPRRTVKPYEAGEDDSRSQISLSWLLGETQDIDTALAWGLLSHVLTGTPASPLRKALIDSGLGEDLTGSGVDPYQREMFYTVGLKGIAGGDADKVESLIVDTLYQLATHGIDKETVAASMNTVEFGMRELNTGGYPRGIALMIGLLPTWIHGGDPMDALAFDGPLQQIKDKLAAGVPFFENLIREQLLNNPHRSTLILAPDSNVRELRDAAERERLERERGVMNQADLQQVMETARRIKAISETPNRPEDLATIPMLQRSDLEPKIRVIPLAKLEAGGTPILYHDLPTNGIAYLDLAFDLHALPAEYLPYVDLFGRALLEQGTATQDPVSLINRIGQQTGGIRASSLLSAAFSSARGAAYQTLRAKAMAAQTGDLIAILKDVLLTANLDNRERFSQIVLEEKAGFESYLMFSGHAVADKAVRAGFSETDWAAEQMGGVSAFFFLRELVERIEQDWPAVLATLEAIRSLLINRAGLVVNVTLDADNWRHFQPQVTDLLDSLPTKAALNVEWNWQRPARSVGLTVPSQVNYVAQGVNLYQHGYELHGSSRVILRYLAATYLHERVRAQGGAYGAMSPFDFLSGGLSFLSYRDPNLLGTLKNYAGAVEFLKTIDLSEDELTKAIIGAIGVMDAHLLPDAKGYASMVNTLVGYTDDMRQQIRDEVLNTTVQDFREFATAVQSVAEHGVVAVVGSKDAISKANAGREGFLEVVPVL